MSHEAQRENLLNAVSLIRSAQRLLTKESRSSTDPDVITKITAVFHQLDSFLSQLLNARAIADDGDFQRATVALKEQATGLQKEADHIKAIVADVGTAAQIAGYIAQAVTVVAML